MDEFNKRTKLQGLPPWPKTPIGVSMPPSTLPLLAPTSFPLWKKPYFTNQGVDNYNKSQDLPPRSYENLDTCMNNHHGDYSDKSEIMSSPRLGRNQLDPNMNPKKLKRIISNRVSAQKSRMKKLHYVNEMERKAKALEAEIAVLHPQVLMVKNQQHLLQMEQKMLSQEVSALANNKLLKDAEIEENKAEVSRLRQLHLAQQQQNIQGYTMVPTWHKHEFEEIINQSLVPSGGTRQMVFMNSNLDQIEEGGRDKMDEWSQQKEVSSSLVVNSNGKLNINSNIGGIEQILNLKQNMHI